MASELPTASKPMKGIGTLSAALSGPLEASIAAAIASGGVALSNVNITGGVIDGVVIGSNEPGPGSFTTLNTGNASGQGYQVCFYGDVVGDSACWLPGVGQWNVQGELLVRDTSDLGNLRVSSNTISATNTNGNINFITNGIGVISIVGGISQTTTTGNLSFFTNSGNISASTTSGTATLSAGSGLTQTVQNGNISITTGNSIPSYSITSISTGSTPTITTSVANGYSAGQQIIISGSNSTPSIDGTYTINSVTGTKTFTITTGSPVTVAGTSGTVRHTNNLTLSTTDAVSITGSTTTINGNLVVNGSTTYLETTHTSMNDPVITIGGVSPPTVSDLMDRGMQARYFASGVAKEAFFGRQTSTGCFTYIQDATNINDVFSGTPGCAIFGGLTATSLNLQGGGITNLGPINLCTITCNSNFTITATTSATITAPTISLSGALSTSSNIVQIGTATNDGESRGISFLYNTGSGSTTGFMGLNEITNCFSFYSSVNIVNGVITGGTLGNTCANTVNATTVNATTVNTQNLNITGQATGLLSVEHLSGSGVINPSPNVNVTFITLTGLAGTSTGTLSLPTLSNSDAFQRYIFLTAAVSGATYVLTCPAGTLLDPGTGIVSTKTLAFNHVGQSIFLMYNASLGCYLIVNAGTCSSP